MRVPRCLECHGMMGFISFTSVHTGASGAWRAGVAAGSQMQLQQPYTAPATLIVGVIIAAAAAAQLFASAFATKADMY